MKRNVGLILVFLMVFTMAVSSLGEGKSENLDQLSAEELCELGWDAYDKGDYAKAFECFTIGADTGDPEAIFSLGTMYLGGKGTQHDFAKALELFMVAADQGYTPAFSNIGVIYECASSVYDKQWEIDPPGRA